MIRSLKSATVLLFLLFLASGCSSLKNYKCKNSCFIDARKEQKYLKAYDKTLALWPVPYTENDVPTSYGVAHVITAGPKNGEPLVLFHGMGATSTMWYPNIKDFSKNYRVYAIDYLLEPGKSQPLDRGYSNDDIVRWYDEVFDSLKLKKINIIATSRGGWVATNYTLHHTDRVKKLALLAPVQTFGNVPMGLSTRPSVNFTLFPSRHRLKKMLATLSRYPERIPGAYRSLIYYGTKYTHSNFDMLSMKPFTDDELKKLTMPVLVLIGDHDIMNPISVVEKAGKLLPDVSAAVIEDAGHFETIDRTEEVDKRVMEFLNGN